MIYTVFPKDEKELPQDFETYLETEEYGKELNCEYMIESTEGEIY